MTIGELIQTVTMQLDKSSKDRVDRQVKDTGKKGEEAAKKAGEAAKKSVADINKALNTVKSAVTKVASVFGIAFSLSSMNSTIEAFNSVADSVRSITPELEDVHDYTDKILAAAHDCRTAYQSMASTVKTLVTANEDLFPIDDAVTFTGNITKMLKAAGQGDSEISSTLNALSDSFKKGVVDTSVINSLLKKSPDAARLLAKQLGVNKDSLAEMAKEGAISCRQLKDAFVNATEEINESFSKTDFLISDALQYIKDEWGYFLNDVNDQFQITQTIALFMKNTFDRVLTVLKRVRQWVGSLVDRLGGLENAFRLIAVVGGAIFAALNFNKITSALKGISSLLDPIKLKTLAIIAVFVIIALLVEDLIGFLQGKDSFIGTMLSRAGVDTEAVRKKIIEVWTTVTQFLSQTWQNIKKTASTVWKAITRFFDEHGDDIKKGLLGAWQAVSGAVVTVWNFIWKTGVKVFNAVRKFFDEHGDDIKKGLLSAWQAVSGAVIAAWNFISSTARTVFNAVKGFFDENGEGILEGIVGAWQTIVNVLQTVWNFISGVAMTVWGALQGFWNKHGEQLKTAFTNIWNGITTALTAIWNAIKAVAQAVFEGLRTFWDTWGSTIMTYFSNLWDTVATLFADVWNIICAAFQTAVDIITDIFAIFANLFTGNWDDMWESVKQLFSDIWEGIRNILTALLTAINNLLLNWVNMIVQLWVDFVTHIGEAWERGWEWIKNLAVSIFSNLWNSITGLVGNIVKSIKDGFQSAIDWIKSLPEQALQWGADIINNIVQGIKNTVGKVGEAVSGVASSIKGFLGFSEPKEGPLSDFHTYMPDMMDLLNKGINDNKGKIKATINSLAEEMSVLSQVNVVNPKTAAASVSSTVSKNVAMNLNISNTFNGDRAGQREASAAMNRAAEDATSYLAHGLAYAR